MEFKIEIDTISQHVFLMFLCCLCY